MRGGGRARRPPGERSGRGVRHVRRERVQHVVEMQALLEIWARIVRRDWCDPAVAVIVAGMRVIENADDRRRTAVRIRLPLPSFPARRSPEWERRSRRSRQDWTTRLRLPVATYLAVAFGRPKRSRPSGLRSAMIPNPRGLRCGSSASNVTPSFLPVDQRIDRRQAGERGPAWDSRAHRDAHARDMAST